MSRCKVIAVVGVIVVVGALFVLNYSVEVHRKEAGSKQSTASELRQAPVEFLYLDSIRVANYAYQLEGGEKGPVRQVEKKLDSVKADASAGGVNVGASTQEEEEVESTLTPAVSSEMWVLLSELRKDKKAGVALHDVNLEDLEAKSKKKEKIREGWLVRFSTKRLLSPAYMRPYLILRHGATRAALFPTGVHNSASKRRAEKQSRRAAAFTKQIGPNPRFTFAITSSEGKTAADDPVEVLMPVQYKDLTTERDMFERVRSGYAGGKLTVIGKVIRIFPERACAGSSCAMPVFTDLATRETWRRPLHQASHYLIDKVSHGCKAVSAKHPKKRIKGKRCYLAKLNRETRLAVPGMVILPIAVYR